ncbi:MAG: DUF6036 family nucleotidyltransferase [Candidatus Acidiferrales bacterium]|jgi:hypothetical protein
MSADLASPWREFLEELDALLDEPASLHCIGGFAVIVGYGLPRGTNDLDYRAIIPVNLMNKLQDLAGEGSALARKHGLRVQFTGVDCIPESYEDRLVELFPKRFVKLRIFIPDPYDLVLSKLTRNVRRDREDVEFLAKSRNLDAAILKERYVKEMKPLLIGAEDRHDATLAYWIDDYFSKR